VPSNLAFSQFVLVKTPTEPLAPPPADPESVTGNPASISGLIKYTESRSSMWILSFEPETGEPHPHQAATRAIQYPLFERSGAETPATDSIYSGRTFSLANTSLANPSLDRTPRLRLGSIDQPINPGNVPVLKPARPRQRQRSGSSRSPINLDVHISK
jgi:hypothetical protein